MKPNVCDTDLDGEDPVFGENPNSPPVGASGFAAVRAGWPKLSLSIVSWGTCWPIKPIPCGLDEKDPNSAPVEVAGFAFSCAAWPNENPLDAGCGMADLNVAEPKPEPKVVPAKGEGAAEACLTFGNAARDFGSCSMADNLDLEAQVSRP